MRFRDFENVISSVRMGRYLMACKGNTRRAMTLYRKNLQLSQELFTVISCFETSLRNAIDRHCLTNLGSDWLRNGALSNGIFDNSNCRLTAANIVDAVQKLSSNYTHSKLVAELGFGFWRYMFAQNQFTATGKALLKVFPAKPFSTPLMQYNHTFVFKQLTKVNDIRNRIVHHEPICFQRASPVINTNYSRQHYDLILQLFKWMNIDENKLLYGLDHIISICDQIDDL